MWYVARIERERDGLQFEGDEVTIHGGYVALVIQLNIVVRTAQTHRRLAPRVPRLRRCRAGLAEHRGPVGAVEALAHATGGRPARGIAIFRAVGRCDVCEACHVPQLRPQFERVGAQNAVGAIARPDETDLRGGIRIGGVRTEIHVGARSFGGGRRPLARHQARFVAEGQELPRGVGGVIEIMKRRVGFILRGRRKRRISIGDLDVVLDPVARIAHGVRGLARGVLRALHASELEAGNVHARVGEDLRAERHGFVHFIEQFVDGRQVARGKGDRGDLGRAIDRGRQVE